MSYWNRKKHISTTLNIIVEFVNMYALRMNCGKTLLESICDKNVARLALAPVCEHSVI